MRRRRFFLLVLTYFVVFWRLRDPQPACLSNLGPLPPVGRHSFPGALNPDSILFPFIPPSFLRILCQVALNCQLQLHRRSFHIQPTVKRLEIVPDPRYKGPITLITKASESLPCRFAKYDRIVPALVSLRSGTLSPTPWGSGYFLPPTGREPKIQLFMVHRETPRIGRSSQCLFLQDSAVHIRILADYPLTGLVQ